jgi:methylthioribose-1-phosphate isomerase
VAAFDPGSMRQSVAWVDDTIEIIDQTRLPDTFAIVELSSVEAVVDAIHRLAVRGAPAIGACGALGIVIGLDEQRPRGTSNARAALDDLVEIIGSARPTAVNLRWAVERVRDAATTGRTPQEIRTKALAEALALMDEDKDACTRIGEAGRMELGAFTNIMTHCNTGRLTTAGWGTALGAIYAKAAAGEPVSVMACEDAGIDVTLMPDASSAAAMASGKVDAVIVGADRIAANGDTANKIGTFTHAVNAKYAGIPFYVAASLATFDTTIATGDEIPIELRPDHELTQWRGRQTAPKDAATWNPAFDVTPAGLITAIITEAGVLRPPFQESIRSALDRD